jgi:hypothetical protein
VRDVGRTLASLPAVAVCLAAVAGCGSQEERQPFQRVAFCQGPSSDNPNSDPVRIEFRQGRSVVARAEGSVGIAFTAEVPLGAVQIYVDGVQKGAVNEGVATDGPYRPPAPDEVIYIASEEGCPPTATS